ncbi:hypothetical protein J2847_002734 [Azospirillum agricola]|uniref:hypothetical protein n=1 Tax=Azospirillum agricola TaxID=1720247 RepID=UPI001AEA269F|nr:hypothetical protein [Azospirillum agricola]MBP2229435.1 hypothetical protein [Azospirillum agricola]
MPCGSPGAKAVVARMRATPVRDMFVRNGTLREDGPMEHDLDRFQVMAPAESGHAWDCCNPKRVVPGKGAFQPPSESTRSFVGKTWVCPASSGPALRRRRPESRCQPMGERV